jgi:hypothetical protein
MRWKKTPRIASTATSWYVEILFLNNKGLVEEGKEP